MLCEIVAAWRVAFYGAEEPQFLGRDIGVREEKLRAPRRVRRWLAFGALSAAALSGSSPLVA